MIKGFNMNIGEEINKSQNKETIINSIQQNFYEFIDQSNERKVIFSDNILTTNMVVLCLDRFVDYLFDKVLFLNLKSYLVIGE